MRPRKRGIGSSNPVGKTFAFLRGTGGASPAKGRVTLPALSRRRRGTERRLAPAIPQVRRAVGEAALVDQLEIGPRTVRQRALATADQHRDEEQLELVDEPRDDGRKMREKVMGKLLSLDRALEFQMDRSWDDRWDFNGTYTLAFSRGNAEGPVDSDTNFDDSGRTENFDNPWVNLNGFGYLANDRRHQLKLRGSFGVTVMGRGRQVIGGSLTTNLTSADIRTSLMDGFFPYVFFESEPHKFATPLNARPVIQLVSHHSLPSRRMPASAAQSCATCPRLRNSRRLAHQ